MFQIYKIIAGFRDQDSGMDELVNQPLDLVVTHKRVIGGQVVFFVQEWVVIE